MNSYLAILIGGLIPMALGFAWYHKGLFGNAWMKSIGMTEDELKAGGNMGMIMGLAVAISIFLAWRMNAYSSHTEPGMSQFVHGFFHGAYSMGLPAALVLVSNGLFERRSMNNLIINALYWIVALGLMGSFLYSVATPEAPPVGG